MKQNLLKLQYTSSPLDEPLLASGGQQAQQECQSGCFTGVKCMHDPLLPSAKVCLQKCCQDLQACHMYGLPQGVFMLLKDMSLRRVCDTSADVVQLSLLGRHSLQLLCTQGVQVCCVNSSCCLPTVLNTMLDSKISAPSPARPDKSFNLHLASVLSR